MKIFTLIVILAIVIQTHCSPNSNGRKINRRLTFFDIELLRVTSLVKSGNVVVSPASVKSTLALLLAGAEGDTAREIEIALRFSRDENVFEQLRWYIEALNGNSSTAVLQNANGVFASKELKLKPNFLSTVRRFGTEVTPVDFTEPSSAAITINNWVSQHTGGLIPFVVEPIHVTPPNDLIIANALYFKSTWHHSFDPRETRPGCFFRRGDCSKVPMMELETELNYAHVEDLRAHAVELPYEGNRYSMILLVPLSKDGIGPLLRDLPYVGLPSIMELMRPQDVSLAMPRFTVNYNENLVDALRKTHITTLFTNKSNLTNIFEERPSHVNSFHHKVFISVDETGTVAAASSSAAIVPLMFDGVVQVTADRPFLFFIKDNEFDVVLFEGKIEEPGLGDRPDYVFDGRAPTRTPVVENIVPAQIHGTGSTKQKPQSNSFIESLKNIFG